MLAIVGASGKLGGATLAALLSYKLAEPSEIVAITSSQPGSETWRSLESKGVTVRHGTFEDGATLEAALQGCDKFFLVSTPRVELDYNDAPEGQGREKHHKVAIDAALRAGVKHIYYSSLGFGRPSKAGVMRAHIRTETYLESLGDKVTVTVMREGLYNESWPLYLMGVDPKSLTALGIDHQGDEGGDEVRVPGDGKVSWTAIEDLGLASSLVLVPPGAEYAGKTFYLSTPPALAKTLQETAALVTAAGGRGKDIRVTIVDHQGHEDFYVGEKKMDRSAVQWWVGVFDALKDGETLIDDPTLSKLLASKGKKPITMEETVKKMVKG
ncbi:hypothetical protein PFICI_08827 [Pestalotiopsis fici W106-1]|uniref:NmrA-like domain-containing protein n=1 Tax=Pestalotiopsis fici (strain W106-1 / CGMCC3.15140) TaxID=1229662 RepID=W3WYW4_PESFW|nr:uncharacterized protein PFICI_08827 [Pestalotiopsis fici W106-1]ETS78974.1 hypothetical protein PFICI_08827 [Pestalotiopsis fici W106-1]